MKKEVCFTGFYDAEEQSNIKYAQKIGYTPVDSVTVDLSVLCLGPNPGARKMIQALQQQDVKIMDFEQFQHMHKTGEFPNPKEVVKADVEGFKKDPSKRRNYRNRDRLYAELESMVNCSDLQ